MEINLTAEVVDWDILDGETVEIWGYDGQYPSPAIRATVGDKVRVNLTNDLPEAATIHWHGLEVPNDQDGVPGITQRGVQPGETWTYEYIAPKAGTAMSHPLKYDYSTVQRPVWGLHHRAEGRVAPVRSPIHPHAS